jgi:hypothetical protein
MIRSSLVCCLRFVDCTFMNNIELFWKVYFAISIAIYYCIFKQSDTITIQQIGWTFSNPHTRIARRTFDFWPRFFPDMFVTPFTFIIMPNCHAPVLHVLKIMTATSSASIRNWLNGVVQSSPALYAGIHSAMSLPHLSEYPQTLLTLNNNRHFPILIRLFLPFFQQCVFTTLNLFLLAMQVHRKSLRLT